MQLALRQELIDRLLTMPESGMGYQIVDLVLTDGRVVPNVPILNCEVASLPDSFSNVRASDVANVRLAVSNPVRR
jgi:hypothetical protein